MKPTGWTLTYSDPATKAVIGTVPLEGVGALEGGQGKLVSMGIKCEFVSHGAGTVTLRLPGIDPKTAPKIPFESPIVIKDGTGTPQFQGKRTDRRGDARPGQTSITITIEDAYYDLAHITYKEPPNIVGGFPWPDVVLFQDAMPWLDAGGNPVGTNPPGVTANPGYGGYIKTSDMIVRVLKNAIAAHVNIQIGTIDLCERQPWPAGVSNPNNQTYQNEPQGYYVSFYPSRCVKISEAIQFSLRVHPDCFTEIDYTTTPPTFNVRRRSALFTPNPGLPGTPMSAMSLPYSYTDANGLRHTATDIQERPELQPKRIAIYYQITGSTSGGPTMEFIIDAYGGSPASEIPSTYADALLWLAATEEVRAMDYSVNLAGATTVTTSAYLRTLPFNPYTVDLWKLKCNPLKATDITNLTGPTNVLIKDDNGNLISNSCYLDAGQVTSIMGGVDTPVVANVTADFSYTKPSGHLAKANHQMRLKLTNGPWNKYFSSTQTTAQGESVPAGLAKGLFTVLSPMQYSLSHHILETKGFQGFVKPGKHCVNLVVSPADVVAGDLSAQWAAMNASVQSTEYTLHTDGNGNVFAEFSVKCGPVEHLEAGELVQLMNLFTNRRTAEYDMTARVGGGVAGSVALGTDTDKENSTHDAPTYSAFNIFTPDGTVAGNPDSTKPQINLATADVQTNFNRNGF
jgi:hypothetical protein